MDPVQQEGTNARVLNYMLRPENQHYSCLRVKGGARMTGARFLEKLASQTDIRLLLDVGAQMLDMSNVEVARAWLQKAPVSVVGAIRLYASLFQYWNTADGGMLATRLTSSSAFFGMEPFNLSKHLRCDSDFRTVSFT